jgi:biopolymer transport protein ExbB/TolQ
LATLAFAGTAFALVVASFTVFAVVRRRSATRASACFARARRSVVVELTERSERRRGTP